jgi:virginiamycin B lyase
MLSVNKLLVALALTLPLGATAFAATITGNVQGPDGKPFMGAFVVAENIQNKMTVSVLSDAQGRYHIDHLTAATYTVRIKALGYRSDPREGVQLGDDQKASFDFALQKAMVSWSDLTTYQGRQLLPHTANHDLSYQDPFFTTCLQACHSFQKRMATNTGDEDAWRQRVKYMNEVMIGRRLSDETIEDFTSYLTTMFGPNSPKPQSTEDLPQYQSLVRPFSPGAMNIVYVEYDFDGGNGMGPWSAVEDKDGMFWIPYYGRGNAVVRLDPKTAELTQFPLPFPKIAATGVHSAIPAPDGTVWFTELAAGRIGHLDPKTKEITEYQNTPLPDGKHTTAHTIRVDDSGRVWTSGGPAISMFDPKYERFTHFDLGGTYGNVVGHNGDEWFTSFVPDGPIARVSKDGVLTRFDPPTKGKPQRLQVDADGIVWFTERRGGKIGRLDPTTGTFKEFPLPGPEPSPYAIGIDRDHMIWYSSHEQDTLGRLDPRTGEVTEYPYPHSEISMRELFLDSQGRMWYASSVNNKVGYFYLANDADTAAGK